MRRFLSPDTVPAPGKRTDGRNGFTLVELAIVLVIIGLLAGLATYTYRKMIEKARMTQARVVLQHLAKMETTYYGNNDRYTNDLHQLDFDPVKYNYYKVSVILDNNAQEYTGIATGIGAMNGDWWTIVKDGEPVQSDNSVFK